jgi:hypothetical protein
MAESVPMDMIMTVVAMTATERTIHVLLEGSIRLSPATCRLDVMVA